MSLGPEDQIRTREEFAAFVQELHQEWLTRGREWENSTLDRFLEALAAWTGSAEGWYRNVGEEVPEDGDWTFLARALRAATVYE